MLSEMFLKVHVVNANILFWLDWNYMYMYACTCIIWYVLFVAFYPTVLIFSHGTLSLVGTDKYM